MEYTGYTKNPLTNRPIKIGSKVWRELVKEGKLSDKNVVDENELYELKPADDSSEIIKQLDKELPPNIKAVRGRGKYRGKIVTREKPFDNLKQTVDIVKKATVKAVKKLPKKVDSDNEEDWEKALENMIMEEIVKPRSQVGKKEVEETEEEYEVEEVEKEEDGDVEEVNEENDEEEADVEEEEESSDY